MGVKGLSSSTISSLMEQWAQEYTVWLKLRLDDRAKAYISGLTAASTLAWRSASGETPLERSSCSRLSRGQRWFRVSSLRGSAEGSRPHRWNKHNLRAYLFQ